MSHLQDRFVVFPCRQCPSQYLFECKSHYIDSLVEELGFDKSFCNHKYTPKTLTKETTRNHRKTNFVSRSLRFSTTDEELYLHPFYWIPKLHKCPYQSCSISKCSPRNMQTISLHSINNKKCVISYSRCGVNQLLILTKCNDIQPRPNHAKILTHFPYSKLKQTKLINLTVVHKQ